MKLVYLIVSLFLIVTTKVSGSNINIEIGTDSLIASITKQFNEVMKNNEELRNKGQIENIQYVLSFNINNSLTSATLLDCEWIFADVDIISPDVPQNLCTKYTEFNNKNKSNVNHYILFLNFPDVVLGTTMIAGQRADPLPVAYYVNNQNDVNWPAYESMINLLQEKLPIPLTEYPESEIENPEKILTIASRWILVRNGKRERWVAWYRNWNPSEFLSDVVMFGFNKKVDDDNGDKWSLAELMQSSIDYFDKFIHPAQMCFDIADHVDYLSAQTFADNFCTLYNPPQEFIPYLWSLAEFIDEYERLNLVSLPQNEINFLTSFLNGFITQTAPVLSWDNYIKQQITENIELYYLGYVIYKIGQENWSPELSSQQLTDLVVNYLIHHHQNNSYLFYDDSHDRKVLKKLLTKSWQSMDQTECTSLVNTLTNTTITLPGNQTLHVCLRSLWDISNDLWTPSQKEAEIFKVLEQINKKSKGITDDNVSQLITNNPTKIVYWNVDDSHVSDLSPNLLPEERKEFAHNIPSSNNADFNTVSLTIKHCVQTQFSPPFTYICALNGMEDFGIDGRYSNLDPFSILYVISPTNVSFIDPCNGNPNCKIEGVAPVSAISLAFSIEKDEDENIKDHVILGVSIVSLIATVGEAYPLLASSSLWARILGGFIILNETIINGISPTAIYNQLILDGIPMNIATSIKNGLTALKITGTAVDLVFMDPNDAMELLGGVKIAKYERKALNGNIYNEIENLAEIESEVLRVVQKKIAGSDAVLKSKISSQLGFTHDADLFSDKMVELVVTSRALGHNFIDDVNGLNITQINRLLEDLEDNADLASEMAALPNGMKAWKACNAEEDVRENIEKLSKVSTYFENNPNNIVSFTDEFEATISARRGDFVDRTSWSDNWKQQIDPDGQSLDFEPQGLDIEFVPQSIIDEMAAEGVTIQMITDILKSGSTDPIKISVSSGYKLYKIIPKGNSINNNSSYWINLDQLNMYNNTVILEQKLGMPVVSLSAKYDVYQKEVISGQQANIFESTIANTVELSYDATGGAVQSLILNHSNWTAATKISSLEIFPPVP